jgi:hypothetical protein
MLGSRGQAAARAGKQASKSARAPLTRSAGGRRPGDQEKVWPGQKAGK